MRLFLLLLFLSSYLLWVKVLPSFCVFATRYGALGQSPENRTTLLVLGAVALVSLVLLLASLAPRRVDGEVTP